MSYLATMATMTVSSAGVTIDRPGSPAVDGSTNVYGPYRGALTFPVLGCGKGYRIAVDVPEKYPSTCGSDYNAGSDQGLLTWGVTASPREA